ncbi:DNA polymerase accessory protein [Pantoea phage Phynn]|nr:DNA polymerase accessory protein [Pantoea phage Phynn]
MSLAAFLDEPELNEHEAAWRSRDWDAIESLCKSYTKEKESNFLFDVLGQLQNGKQRMIVSNNDAYSKFYIDNAMSQHIDTMMPAYVMNLVGHGLPDQAHFDYYLDSVRASKRYGAWAKLTEDHEEKVILSVLRKVYGINTRVAMEYKEEIISLGIMDKWKSENRPIALSILDDVITTKTDRGKVEKLIRNNW